MSNSPNKIPRADAEKILHGLTYGIRLDDGKHWPGLGNTLHRWLWAGSYRRGKSEVGDLDIVAVPKLVESPQQALFEGAEAAEAPSLAWRRLEELRTAGDRLKPSSRSWAEKETTPIHRARKLKFQLPRAAGGRGVTVEVDLVPAASWGSWALVRTGSAEFSRGCMERAAELGLEFRDGYFLYDISSGQQLDTSDERKVFDALRLDWVEPEKRIDGDVVRQAAWRS